MFLSRGKKYLGITLADKVKLSGQRAFTLVELLSTLAASAVTILVIVTALQHTTQSSVSMKRVTLVQQEVNWIAHFISQEVERAGYFHHKVASLITQTLPNNPYLDANTQPQIGQQGQCMTLGYFRPCAGGGLACTYSGFKLQNHTIRKRIGGIGSTKEAPNCTRGSWQTISSDDLIVTELLFTPIAHSCWDLHKNDFCMTSKKKKGKRKIWIPQWRLTVAAHWRNHPQTKYRVMRRIRSRNYVVQR